MKMTKLKQKISWKNITEIGHQINVAKARKETRGEWNPCDAKGKPDSKFCQPFVRPPKGFPVQINEKIQFGVYDEED